MRLDTFHGPLDIPAYSIAVLWLVVTVLDVGLVACLWPYRRRTFVKFVLSALCADLVQVLVSMVEAVGINVMREYRWWCSVSVSAEEASWAAAGYSLLLLCTEMFFRSTWRRGVKRRTLRRHATIVILTMWIASVVLHSISIPFYGHICEPYTMDEQYRMVYKISLVSMNLLLPMAWAILLLVKTAHNLERNLQSREDWMKDLGVILLINFVTCWVVKQLPTAVFWEYREVFIVTDNIAYVLSNVRCLVTAMILILFFSEITSLSTCECSGELNSSTAKVVSTNATQRQVHQGGAGGGGVSVSSGGGQMTRSSRAHTPPPLANANDL